jgi:hypothetical protein
MTDTEPTSSSKGGLVRHNLRLSDLENRTGRSAEKLMNVRIPLRKWQPIDEVTKQLRRPKLEVVIAAERRTRCVRGATWRSRCRALSDCGVGAAESQFETH